MKIVIAVDDSPHSERALHFVCRLAWPAGSRVLVVSAWQPLLDPLMPAYEPPIQLAESLDEMRKAHQKLIDHAGAQVRAAGLATETRLLQGDPRDALVEFARAERADLLVMGSHGRTGFSKLMLGSVSSHVVTHASCSVLVVKQEKS